MRELQLAFISNRSTKRIFRILNVIERERLVTNGELAESLNVTQRTIANDLKFIKDYFHESISLFSGYNGFQFIEKNPSLYQERKQSLLENECLFEIVGNIFKGRLSQIGELAHHYHFSESSFRRIFEQSTPILNSYGLKWVSNPLNIEGSESDLRKFFKDFYYEGVQTIFTLTPGPELHELILKSLKGKLGSYELGSGTTPSAFYYTFYIAIMRSSLGFNISVPDELAQLAYQGENFSLLYSLKKGIEKIYGVNLSKEEFAWVYLVTVCKRTLDREDQEQLFFEQFNQGNEIAQLTDDFLKELEIPKSSYGKISTFLRAFFLSRRINYSLSPVLNKEASDVKEAIIQGNSQNYQRNLRFLMEKKDMFSFPSKDIQYLEDVCVSLTIYSSLILDLYSPTKTIYFLLEGDHFICQQIRTRAIQQFGDKHSLTFLPLQSLTKEEINAAHIDLIVTNYSRYLLDYIKETDYVLLKAVPDEQEWQKLERKIDPYRTTFF